MLKVDTEFFNPNENQICLFVCSKERWKKQPVKNLKICSDYFFSIENMCCILTSPTLHFKGLYMLKLLRRRKKKLSLQKDLLESQMASATVNRLKTLLGVNGSIDQARSLRDLLKEHNNSHDSKHLQGFYCNI